MSSLSLGKDFITLEEVKSNFYSIEFRLKASENGDEAFTYRLSVTDFAIEQKKKKGKGRKKTKADPKGICNYGKESGQRKRDSPKKAKKDFLALIQNDSALENDLVLVVGEQLQQHSKQWLLDSDCSYHT